jgi:hypothetical protein
LFHYWLTYGLEPQHYHLEGYGRLSSLWLVATATALVFLRNGELPLHSPERLAISAVLLFAAASINPVNVLFTGALLVFAFVLQHPRQSWQLAALLLLIPAMCLDPYYLELLSGQSRSGGVEFINPSTLDLSLGQLATTSIERFPDWLGRGKQFFSFPYAPGFLITLFALVFSLLLLLDERRFAAQCAAVLGVVFATWVVFSPIFEILAQDTRFRLLLPYFQYARMQALYVLLLLMLVVLTRRLIQESNGVAVPVLATVLIGAGLNHWQNDSDIVNKRARAGYCGPMGCMSADDRKVLLEAEALRRQDKETEPPRMLVPNVVSVHGPEKWLMPRGGSRAAIHFETPPLAFYYYQGDAAYTLGNYQQYVCDGLSVEWLQTHKIQYLFIPSHQGNTCIPGIEDLDIRFETLAASGQSRLYRL